MNLRLLNLSIEELVAKQKAITDDPANLNPDKTSWFIYKPSARKKLADLQWAVYHKLQDKRREQQ